MPARFAPLAITAAEQILKSGLKTTEAWLTFLALLLMAAGAYADVSPIWGVAGALVVGAYSLSRAQAKTAAADMIEVEPEAPPLAGRFAEPPPNLAKERPMPRSILALALVGLLAACTPQLAERPGYSQAVTCDAVAPLHQRLEVAVRQGSLDDRLDEVQALNNRYRAVCAHGEALPGQAAALLDDIALILQGVEP